MPITRSQQTQDTILSVLRANGGQMSAYDIAAEMRADNPKIAPTTIYRAMAVLTDKGLAHRVESTNAFMACRHDGEHDAAILSVCDSCGGVDESIAPELAQQMTSAAQRVGFAPKRHVMEVHGVCATCEPQTQSEAQGAMQR